MNEEPIDKTKDLHKLLISHFKQIKWDYCCDGMDCACYGLPTNIEHYFLTELLEIEKDASNNTRT